MASANTAPIYSGQPDVGNIIGGTTGNTTTGDLSGAGVVLGYTADATNGSYIRRIRFAPLGTNVATVVRIWLNNGSTNATAANNTLIGELTLAATTVNQVAAQAIPEFYVNEAIPPSWRVYFSFGTATAAGFNCTTFAGKYTA